MKTYFAHPVIDYDTAFEARCRLVLADRFADVLDPNGNEHQVAYKAQGWPYFDALVETCQVCAFVRMPDGRVGAGVAKEVDSFIRRGLPVFEIERHSLDLKPTTESPGPVMTVDETRAAIKAFREAQAA